MGKKASGIFDGIGLLFGWTEQKAVLFLKGCKGFLSITPFVLLRSFKAARRGVLPPSERKTRKGQYNERNRIITGIAK